MLWVPRPITAFHRTGVTTLDRDIILAIGAGVMVEAGDIGVPGMSECSVSAATETGTETEGTGAEVTEIMETAVAGVEAGTKQGPVSRS